MKFRNEAGWTVLFWVLMFFQFSNQVAGQETIGEKAAPKTDNVVTKVIQVKYADVDSLASILRPFFRFGRSELTSNRELKVLVLTSTPEQLALVEETIKRFDIPPLSTRNIEVTAYLLVGEETNTGAKIPSDLEGVVKQLKSVFPYSSFRLQDTLVVRCRDGREGSVNGMAPSKSSPHQSPLYNLAFRSLRLVAQGNQRIIKIDGLSLGGKIPVEQGVGGGTIQYQYIDTGIHTDVDLLEGQKIVVGKSTVDGSNNAIFLVITAKVVD